MNTTKTSSLVELSIACKYVLKKTKLTNRRSLVKLDKFSQSDPCVVVDGEAERGVWRELGRTEVIKFAIKQFR